MWIFFSQEIVLSQMMLSVDQSGQANSCTSTSPTIRGRILERLPIPPRVLEDLSIIGLNRFLMVMWTNNVWATSIHVVWTLLLPRLGNGFLWHLFSRGRALFSKVNVHWGYSTDFWEFNMMYLHFSLIDQTFWKDPSKVTVSNSYGCTWLEALSWSNEWDRWKNSQVLVAIMCHLGEWIVTVLLVGLSLFFRLFLQPWETMIPARDG